MVGCSTISFSPAKPQVRYSWKLKQTLSSSSGSRQLDSDIPKSPIHHGFGSHIRTKHSSWERPRAFDKVSFLSIRKRSCWPWPREPRTSWKGFKWTGWTCAMPTPARSCGRAPTICLSPAKNTRPGCPRRSWSAGPSPERSTSLQWSPWKSSDWWGFCPSCFYVAQIIRHSFLPFALSQKSIILGNYLGMNSPLGREMRVVTMATSSSAWTVLGQPHRKFSMVHNHQSSPSPLRLLAIL